MTKEELFLKYIDDELTQDEKLEVELLLSENESDNKLFEKVKATRNEVMNALGFLNPVEPISVPAFKATTLKTSKNRAVGLKFWHYAAMVAICVGIIFSIKLFINKKDIPVAGTETDTFEFTKAINNELDCYISPNRCWNKKQMVWTIIEINH